MTPMDDVEAVARAIETANTINYRVVSFRDASWHREAQAAIETLKSRGWTPPSEGNM